MKKARFAGLTLGILVVSGASMAATFAAVGCSSSSPGQNVGGDSGNTFDSSRNPDSGIGPQPGVTGAGCTAAASCQGQGAECFTPQNGWVNGYCTSSCSPSKNSPQNVTDPECPGSGVCLAVGDGGLCLLACSGRSQQNAFFPACPTSYSCFDFQEGPICEPTTFSQCDPTMKGSCPKTDAGAAQTCVQVGEDPVGQCGPSCDLFTQNCATTAQNPQGCSPNSQGEGICASATPKNGDGAPCVFINDCAIGLACHTEAVDGGASTAVCRPMCGGPGNKACTNGKSCVALSATIPTTTVGACGL